jgi:hypothetical protein
MYRIDRQRGFLKRWIVDPAVPEGELNVNLGSRTDQLKWAGKRQDAFTLRGKIVPEGDIRGEPNQIRIKTPEKRSQANSSGATTSRLRN